MRWEVPMEEATQRVLLVEDSVECQMVVERALSECGVELTKAGSVGEARRILEQSHGSGFDLVLLDLTLPDGDGLSLLEGGGGVTLSEETSVFLLTRRGEIEAKLAAFGAGADDYLVKPVSPLELGARVAARLCKLRRIRSRTDLVHRGLLTLHVPQMKALIHVGNGEVDVGLTGKEFKILYFLMRHEGEIRTRCELIREAWGVGIHVLERTVDSHIAGLRRKLGPAHVYVKSVPGLGYRFAAGASGAAEEPLDS